MHRLLFLVFLFVISCAIQAQKIQYDCRLCTLTADDKGKIQKMAEYETAFFTDVFGSRRKQTIRIRYYGDEKKFRNAQRKSVGHVMSETGVYATASRQILIYKWSRFLATSYHETTHAVYHHFANVRPTWINEGLAEYFKGAQIDSAGTVSIREHVFRKAEMKKYVSEKGFSITTVLRASHRKFHNRNESRHYTISWGIVYFMRTLHDDVFKTLLYKVSAGIKSEKAIEEEYPGGLAQLEKDLVLFYQ